jgi:hypothetical protein
MEASFEGGQGPEGAVAPYVEWSGICRNVTSLTTQTVEVESSSEMAVILHQFP